MERRWIFPERRIKNRRLFLAFLMFLLLVPLAYSQTTGGKIPLYIKSREIWVEVAKNPQERSRGLMGRRSLGKDEGMLFIFETESYYGFWMKNTLIPLSIAFINKGGRIVTIADMEPLTLKLHMPTQPVLYALEMHKGWFSTHGIQVGDVVQFSK